MPEQKSLLFEQKQALRKRLLARRKALSPAELKDISYRAQMHVLALPQWQLAAQVLLYCPVNNELDTALLMQSALRQNKQILLPRCIQGQKGQMELAVCPDISCLLPGQFGIMEPNPATCPAFDAASIFPQLAVLPGLAFSAAGLRLGYGGGYYDRFLNRLQTKQLFLLGFGAAFQIIENLPQGEWDHPLDAICTENGIVFC